MSDCKIPRRTFLARALFSTSAVLLAACSAPKQAPQGDAPSGGSTGDSPVDRLANGKGAILELEGEKVAVFKTVEGGVVKLSPKCPHQGCDVAWNDADGTWACPCHNSIFEAVGALVSGPAKEGLKKVS